ncbi:glyoxalase [Verrucomicrobia bacterium LW23]|nr:glyoxalase [Verrucomicrobia bacterium LW23]
MPNSSKSRTTHIPGNKCTATDTEDATPRISSIVETALYVNDLARALRFYGEALQLRRIDGDDRFVAFAAGAHHVLLLFLQGSSLEPVAINGSGTIPPHDAAGPAHIAFGIAPTDISWWRDRLRQHDVEIESEITWPRGGRSLFFRDPEQHLVELITPGVWEVY